MLSWDSITTRTAKKKRAIKVSLVKTKEQNKTSFHCKLCIQTLSSFSFCSNKSLSRSSMSLCSNHIIRLREATSPFWIAKETPLSLWEKENNERWNFTDKISYNSIILWGPTKGGSHVARLNFKTSRVSVYKCLSLIVGFAVAIWPREVVSYHDFILGAINTFWAMSLVGIYISFSSV